MTCPGPHEAPSVPVGPTDLGKPASRATVTPAGQMEPITLEEVMATAHRVAESGNKSYAATNVSVREIIGMAELLVATDATLRRKLLKES